MDFLYRFWNSPRLRGWKVEGMGSPRGAVACTPYPVESCGFRCNHTSWLPPLFSHSSWRRKLFGNTRTPPPGGCESPLHPTSKQHYIPSGILSICQIQSHSPSVHSVWPPRWPSVSVAGLQILKRRATNFKISAFNSGRPTTRCRSSASCLRNRGCPNVWWRSTRGTCSYNRTSLKTLTWSSKKSRGSSTTARYQACLQKSRRRMRSRTETSTASPTAFSSSTKTSWICWRHTTAGCYWRSTGTSWMWKKWVRRWIGVWGLIWVSDMARTWSQPCRAMDGEMMAMGPQ